MLTKEISLFQSSSTDFDIKYLDFKRRIKYRDEIEVSYYEKYYNKAFSELILSREESNLISFIKHEKIKVSGLFKSNISADKSNLKEILEKTMKDMDHIEKQINLAEIHK